MERNNHVSYTLIPWILSIFLKPNMIPYKYTTNLKDQDMGAAIETRVWSQKKNSKISARSKSCQAQKRVSSRPELVLQTSRVCILFLFSFSNFNLNALLTCLMCIDVFRALFRTGLTCHMQVLMHEYQDAIVRVHKPEGFEPSDTVIYWPFWVYIRDQYIFLHRSGYSFFVCRRCFAGTITMCGRERWPEIPGLQHYFCFFFSTFTIFFFFLFL